MLRSSTVWPRSCAIWMIESRVIPGRIEVESAGRGDLVAVDHEDVLARAVGDVALVGEQDRLVVAGAVRLGDREHRVEVDAGRLGHVRDRVRADPLPGRDLDADPVLHPLVAEVRAPGPAHDHGLDRVAGRGDAELAVAVEADRAQVALGQAVDADQLERGLAQLARPSTGCPCTAGARSCAGAGGGRSAGRRPGPWASRSNGCPRRRPVP